MAVATANVQYLIGLKSDINGSVFYFDEQTIVYPCASYCVLYNIENKSMRFLTASEKGAEMSAMAISPNHNYLAVALKYDKPTINILDLYTLRKRKTLISNEVQSCIIVSLSFSSDSRCIVAVCDDPCRTLLYWSWEKSRLIISTKLTMSPTPEVIHHISFNPQDHLHMCVFGNGLLKSLRFVEGALRQFSFPKIESQDFKCYTWVSDECFLVGTSTGKVLFIEGTDLKNEFNVLQYLKDSDEKWKTHGVTAIASFLKGFACACGAKCVYFFEKLEDKECYKMVRQVLLPTNIVEDSKLSDQIIQRMTVSPSEEVLVISTNMKQLYSTPIILPDNKEHTSQGFVFDVLLYGFHYMSVTGLSVCIWKPLIATCSLDSSIRIWNFETFTLELAKEFSEEIHSITMHPLGLFLLAGFSDKLRFMYILRDDLKTFKEFNIRMCRSCSFSRGGHLFAAAQNNVIQVYSSVTLELLANLKGHNAKVQTIIWNVDDSSIISCGLDGAVYDWELKTGKRLGQCVLKSCAYTDVAINVENKLFYAVGSDYSLKEIEESDILRIIPSDSLLTSVAISRSGTMLFVGTSGGRIRSSQYPLTQPGKWHDHAGHSYEITQMTFTYDDRYLVSVSKDASIIIWKIKEAEGRSMRDRSVLWSEEILITKSDLEEKNGMLTELKSRVEELNMENEYQMHLKDMSYNDKIKEMTEKFIQEMESLKTKNQIVQTDKNKEGAIHDEQMSEIMEKHCKELKFIESANHKKLMDEYEKFKDLHNKLLKIQEEYDQQLHEMKEKKELMQDKLTEHYEDRLQDLSKKLEECQKENKLHQREYEETRRQIEVEYDTEIINTKTVYEQQLYQEKVSNTKMEDENTILKKNLLAVSNEMKDNKEEYKRYKMEIKKLNTIINVLEKDVYDLKRELQHQDQSMKDEEKLRFYEVKLRNQELEKYRCDLEYSKIVELKQRRENEIENMKLQIKAMQSELENYTEQFITMDQTIAETTQKLVATKKELSKERSSSHEKTAVLDRILADLTDCVSHIQDPQKLKSSIKVLNSKYLQTDIDKVTSMDPNVQLEWNRQRDHLEYTVRKLNRQLDRCMKNASAENGVLVKRCNQMGELLQLERKKNTSLKALLEKHK